MSERTKINRLVEHLFRHESGRMTAVLTRIFGSANLSLAEDVVQDALIEAIKHWKYKGIPENPSAWLYKVAKNKALNIVNRNKYERQYNSDVLHFLQSPWTAEPFTDHLFSEKEILDDQLRMMFICCHPSISTDSQIALILKTLCGFSITEISKAFLTTAENVNKRLVRARRKIREAKIPFEMPEGAQLKSRIEVVLQAIYLLFNEGYNATTGKDLIRFDLCEEAIRLTEIIVTHPAMKNQLSAFALLSLMQLNASRFKARQDKDGNILTLEHQDRSLWHKDLIKKGLANLVRSADKKMSIYHILAYISAYHCTSKDFASTNWKGILGLYDKLIQIDNSPIVILNRTIALSKLKGPKMAIAELEQIKNNQSIKSYHLFHSVQAELYIENCQFMQASKALKRAIELTELRAERSLLEKRLVFCEKKTI